MLLSILMVSCDDAAFAAGTNDVARAEFPKDKGGDPAFELRFAQETFAFMKNATVLYAKPDIQFFLNAGACGSGSLSQHYRHACLTISPIGLASGRPHGKHDHERNPASY